jgi:V/A-type H+-transporting ATPase subunit D
MDTLAPTRMNLLTRRAQIKLAADGVALLKGKRDALLKELIDRTRELRSLREDLYRIGRTAQTAVAMARAVRGTPEVRAAGHAGRRRVQPRVWFERLWGLELGRAELVDAVRAPGERGLSRLDPGADILEAAEASEKTLKQLVKCAPLERNLISLGREIRKTSRRINALEEYLLPTLKRDVRVITRVLEEREREDRFRLKRIKRKKAVKQKKRTD